MIQVNILKNRFLMYIPGNTFSNKETFGQYPLQVSGFKDIHESLEMATARGEIESEGSDATAKSGQEVCHAM